MTDDKIIEHSGDALGRFHAAERDARDAGPGMLGGGSIGGACRVLLELAVEEARRGVRLLVAASSLVSLCPPGAPTEWRVDRRDRPGKGRSLLAMGSAVVAAIAAVVSTPALIVSGAVALAAAASPIAYAQWYVDGTGGNDANNGLSTATPRKTLPANSAVAANDIVYGQGNVRGNGGLTYDGKNGLSLYQWVGGTSFTILGDTVVTGSWTNTGDGANTTPVAEAVGVTGVAVDYLTSLTTQGFHFGLLNKAASAAACKVTDSSWFHDEAANLLYVRIGANLAPSGFVVSYCDMLGLSLLTFQNSSGNIVDGVTFLLNPRNGVTANSYLLYMVACVSPIIRNCSGQDGGSHIWDVNDCTGMPRLEHNTASGLHDGTYTVFGSVTPGNTISGRVVNDTYYVRGYLLRDQTEMSGTGGPICGYQHPGGGGDVVNVEYIGCDFVGVTGFTMGATVGYDNGTSVADGDRWTSIAYPVRVIGGRTIGPNIEVHPFKSMAHARHRVLGVLARQGFAGSGGIVLDGNGAGSASMLWESCLIVADNTQSNNGNEGGIIWSNDGNSGHKIITNNCTVIDTSVQVPGNARPLVTLFGGADWESRRCILAHKTAHANYLLLRYDDDAATVVDVEDCLYLNMATYSVVAARDTWAEWHSVVDQTGQELTGTPFLSWTTGELDPNHAAYRLRAVNTEHRPLMGVNGVSYAGVYGAYQPAAATRPRRVERVRRVGRAE